MRKTSITELIEQLEYQKEAIPIEAYQKGLAYAIQAAKLKLETEREQIEYANIAGMEFIPAHPEHYKEDSEQYYKETYG